MMLRALPLAEVRHPDDLVECAPYHAVISAACCVLRQAKARKKILPDAHRLCLGCEIGRHVEEQTGGPVELGREHGKDERARSSGGKRGAVVQRAKWGNGTA